MNYQSNTFGMDIIFAILAVDEESLAAQHRLNHEINQDFIQQRMDEEIEVESFLSQFYNQPISKIYTNFDRICTIREILLEEDDCIVVKKYEDE